MKTGIASWEK